VLVLARLGELVRERGLSRVLGTGREGDSPMR
jgi:hypothetical protein